MKDELNVFWQDVGNSSGKKQAGPLPSPGHAPDPSRAPRNGLYEASTSGWRYNSFPKQTLPYAFLTSQGHAELPHLALEVDGCAEEVDTAAWSGG